MDAQCRGHYFQWIHNFEVIIIRLQISLETYFRWKTLNLASTISIELVPIKDGKYLTNSVENMFRNEWNIAIMVFLDQKCYVWGDESLDTLDQIS